MESVKPNECQDSECYNHGLSSDRRGGNAYCQWHDAVHHDMYAFRNSDPNFPKCIEDLFPTTGMFIFLHLQDMVYGMQSIFPIYIILWLSTLMQQKMTMKIGSVVFIGVSIRLVNI